MADITNSDRASWAAEALDAFSAVCEMDGEDNVTKAKDLISNLVHFMRLECGLSFEEAEATAQKAIRMAEIEYQEDEDGEED